MKQFTRIEPSVHQTVGERFKKVAIIKHFQTEDGLTHEFTTWLAEGVRCGGVIALTPDNQVITTYQFRSGPEKWMYEIPGGGFKPEEDPCDAAMRELQEETGFTSNEVTFLGISSRDSITNAKWYYYLALNCRLTENGRQLDTEEEEQGAEVRLISIDEFIHHSTHDGMTDPAAVLMAYEKLKEIANGSS